jgi:hypothetical protein
MRLYCSAERSVRTQTQPEGELLLGSPPAHVHSHLRNDRLRSSCLDAVDGTTTRIAFAAGTSADTLYERAASGAGKENELLKKKGEPMFPTSWSRDGRVAFRHAATCLGPQHGFGTRFTAWPFTALHTAVSGTIMLRTIAPGPRHGFGTRFIATFRPISDRKAGPW